MPAIDPHSGPRRAERAEETLEAGQNSAGTSRAESLAGWLPRDAPDVGTGEVGTAGLETVVRIQVRVNGSTRRIDEAVFKSSGSTVAIASASLVVERLIGATVEDARSVNVLAVVAELALPLEQASAATLAVDAARHAVDDWERKQ